jgi:hypothetical protein
MIRSQQEVAAPAGLVHELLTDVATWRLWSPHVHRVDGPPGPVATGWSGLVKPWFGPATRMEVDWSEPGRGIRWHSVAYRHRLDYADLIEPTGADRCVVTMTATVSGPAGAAVQAAVGPLSAYGQRRRLARLAALAEFAVRRVS